MKRIGLTFMAFLTLASGLSAQIQGAPDAPQPTPKPVVPGEIQPFFWIGGQAITTLGYNAETGASGMAWTGDTTWASFNVALVDSHYDTPKKVVIEGDPDVWALSFRLTNPTARLNSYSSGPEMNYPSWGLAVRGQGFRFGFFHQGDLVDGGSSGNEPGMTMTGADEVLYLGSATAGTSQYLTASETAVKVTYSVRSSVYGSYEVKDLYKLTLTAGTRASTEMDTSTTPATSSFKGKDNGYVGALNFETTPLGPGSYDEPVTFKVTADAIGAVGYASPATGNPLGFGVGAQVDWYLDDDVFLSPLVAFDGRVNDTWSSGLTLATGTLGFDWKAGGGLMLTLSPKRWVADDYGELPDQGAGQENFEYAKIQKFTYVQLLADYARSSVAVANRDINLTLKAEEPDGIVGIDENLGCMAEFRLANLTQANPGAAWTWSSIGRVSYDLSNRQIVPYLRAYLDSDNLFKLRFGTILNPIPGVVLEATYMSANLNSSISTAQDTGRIELVVGFSSDNAFKLPKNMLFNQVGNE